MVSPHAYRKGNAMAQYVIAVHTRDPKLAQWLMSMLDENDGGRVVGLYPIPDKDGPTCTCLRTRKSGWTRNFKTGWMVCDVCGHPAKHERTNIGVRMFSALGRNLMKRERTPLIFRNPEGW